MNKILAEFNLSNYQLAQFNLYYEKLIETNKYLNLTSIIDKEEVYIKHFYDSLLLSKTIELDNKTLIDIGAGAGFPSIPLLILNPSLKVTIVEALNKRCIFLKELKSVLKLDNLDIIHSRAEDYIINHREYYDLGTARAVAKLNMLVELVSPFIKVNGYFLPLKTNDKEEYLNASNAIKTLNLVLGEEYNFTLPNDMGSRVIYKFKKIKACNLKYPRSFAKIKQKPL